MSCENCGYKNPKEANFCEKCGFAMHEKEPSKNIEDVNGPTSVEDKSARWSFERYKLSSIDLPTAEKHIKNAWIAGVVVIILSALALLTGYVEPIGWVDVVIFIGLVLGVYKKSRFCGVGLVVFLIFEKIFQFSTFADVSFWQIIVAFVFLHYFYLGALGTIQYSKLSTKKSAVDNVAFGVVIGIVIAVFAVYFVYLQGTIEEQAAQPSAVDVVFQADYNEGYKAGYTDGRSIQGQFWDSFSGPATEERKEAYTYGYLAGFVKGCREGGFDCTEYENALSEVEGASGDFRVDGIQLIPSREGVF